ncbi:MAG TPA: metallophosphoesterase family protein, partial [Acidimicrobiales bacterium]|nr:metallophosphoesterase family protein [Acidimicrobiales bacterium]
GLSHQMYQLDRVRDLLEPTEIAAVADWPIIREIEFPAGKVLLLHGSPPDPQFGYVYPDTDLEQFGVMSYAAVFLGNTHRPFIRVQGDTTWINVGSCGLPRDDGRYGAAALFDIESGQASIVRFDITGATRQALKRCPDVMEPVRQVFHRRATELVGSIRG